MRHLRVTYRRSALIDLQNIYNSVFEISQNHLTARRYVERIENRCDRIGFAPRGGRPRNDLETGLRTVPFERSALIAYKVDDNRVDITNIFYGGRDYQAFYLGTSPEDEDRESNE